MTSSSVTTVPRLVRVCDPFGKLLASRCGAPTYNVFASSLLESAETIRVESNDIRVNHLNVVIRNPADLSRCWEGRFLIDTDAIGSLVPRLYLEAVRLDPKGQRVYELADGSEIKMDVTTGDIEFMDEIIVGLIIIGDADAEPLMGVAALEFAGVEVDPRSQRLKKLPADRFRTSSPAATSVSISSA